MKRSDIEKSIGLAKDFLSERRFYLPEFAYWSLDDWRANRGRTALIKRLMLGWDVTDYGMGNFPETGSILFTIRNGIHDDANAGTPYAEKVIIICDGQRLPMHYHASKTEDIINRGGGKLFMKLYNALPDGRPDFEKGVAVYRDGILYETPAGAEFLIEPGSSISLTPRLYHIFGAKKGFGCVLAGEVSSINDDRTDNYYYEEIARFSDIDEDVPACVPLCNEYDRIPGL